MTFNYITLYILDANYRFLLHIELDRMYFIALVHVHDPTLNVMYFNRIMATSIDLVVSTAYIGVTIWIAYWLRLYALFYLNSYPLTRILALEFIATAELCGACFELIISKFVRL